MRNNINEIKPINGFVASRSYRDEATYNKIQRHLVDINDIITEEDIRNIKIFIGPGDVVEAGKEEKSLLLDPIFNQTESEEETEKEYREGKKINTPWNIVVE
jgi:hypothetical protein